MVLETEPNEEIDLTIWHVMGTQRGRVNNYRCASMRNLDFACGHVCFPKCDAA